VLVTVNYAKFAESPLMDLFGAHSYDIYHAEEKESYGKKCSRFFIVCVAVQTFHQ
jgi:hypothetical protein